MFAIGIPYDGNNAGDFIPDAIQRVVSGVGTIGYLSIGGAMEPPIVSGGYTNANVAFNAGSSYYWQKLIFDLTQVARSADETRSASLAVIYYIVF